MFSAPRGNPRQFKAGSHSPTLVFTQTRKFSDSGPARASAPGEMKHTAAQLGFTCFFATAFGMAQPQQTGADRLINAPPAETAIPLKQLPLDILHDQRTVWTFPGKLVRGQHWKPVLAVSLVTAGLVAIGVSALSEATRQTEVRAVRDRGGRGAFDRAT
jgi:hypothetical protein